MENFYLVTTELRVPYEPRKCHVIRRLCNEIRDDLALVKIIPPLKKEIYDTAGEISQVILAARHEEMSLFPITQLPLPVYICISRDPIDIETGFVPSDALIILDWGEVVDKP